MAEAKKLGLQPIETTMARLDRVAAGLTAPDSLEEAAFALALGGVSTPVQTPAGLVVLQSLEAIRAGVPPPPQIKDKVAPSVKPHKAETAPPERGEQLPPPA